MMMSNTNYNPETGTIIATDNDYRYSFQGQEKDNEIKGDDNSVNYKYRMHDPRVGRFFAVDPLASEYPHNGPYNFSENIVIHGIELEGLEVVELSGKTSYLTATGLKNGIYDLSDPNNEQLRKNTYNTIGTELQENYTYKVHITVKKNTLKYQEIDRFYDKIEEGVEKYTVWEENVYATVEIFNDQGEYVGTIERQVSSNTYEQTICEGCRDGYFSGGSDRQPYNPINLEPDEVENKEPEKFTGTKVDTTTSIFEANYGPQFAGKTLKIITTTEYKDGEIISQKKDSYIDDDFIDSETTQ